MVEHPDIPFTRAEALELWARLVAGWANNLNSSGSRTLLDGIPNYAESGGSYEGVTRMLWGLGSWLADPERPAHLQWRGVTYDLEQLTYRALVNGCDPDAPGSWRHEPVRRAAWDQRTVESAQVAFVTWQTRDRLWARMTDTERGHLVGFLDQVGQRPAGWGSNWALFWVLNHAARKALNVAYDQSIIDDVMTGYLDGVYCGDGWYDDAPRRGPNNFDNYITWERRSGLTHWASGPIPPGCSSVWSADICAGTSTGARFDRMARFVKRSPRRAARKSSSATFQPGRPTGLCKPLADCGACATTIPSG